MGILHNLISLKFKNRITRFLFGYVTVETVETRKTTEEDTFVDITCTPTHQYYLSKDEKNWFVSHNCDDLITEQNYDSKAAMESIYDWWPGGFESRLLENGKIVMINTRWSQSDPAGWLLERSVNDELLDQWEVIKVPAILDEKAAALLGLPAGGSYCPQRWPLERLEKIKRGMANFKWLALYQQEPVAQDGNVIKTENFVTFSLNQKIDASSIIITADTAFSTKNTADFSVCQVWAVTVDERVDSLGETTKVPCIALIDMIRGRFEYPDLVKKCHELETKHRPDVWVIEKKASGQSLIQDLRRRGFFIHEYTPDKDKLSRVIASTPFIEDRRVMVPDCKWAEDFICECKAFPKGSHDDTVDTASMAILYLRDNFHLKYDQESEYDDEVENYREAMASRKLYW